MKHLIIIGAGGMGRTMYDMARESVGFGIEYDILGFIDDNTSALDKFSNYPPLIAPIQGYQPKEDEVFVCSIGGASRQKCMEEIISKGGTFLTMIHSTARIGTNVQIGEGTIVGAYTTIAFTIGKIIKEIQSHPIIYSHWARFNHRQLEQDRHPCNSCWRNHCTGRSRYTHLCND